MWKQQGRNALGTVKTALELKEMSDEVHSLTEVTLANTRNLMREVLEPYCWPEDVMTMWLTHGRLMGIIHSILTNYQALLMHLLSIANTEGWATAKTELDYFAKGLLRVRMYASSRFFMIMEHYTYLRDLVANGFATTELLALKQKVQQKKLSALLAVSSLDTDGRGKGKDCYHCGTTFHAGGKQKCPFGKLTRAKAKQAGKMVISRVERGDDKATVFDDVLATMAVAGEGGETRVDGSEELALETPMEFNEDRCSYTLGTINLGLSPLAIVDQSVNHQWICESERGRILREAPHLNSSATLKFDGANRRPKTFLRDHPVQVLLSNKTKWTSSKHVSDDYSEQQWVKVCPPNKRPLLVVELWKASDTWQGKGPLDKGRRKSWQQMGYQQHTEFLDSVRHGSAVKEELLVVTYMQQSKVSNSEKPRLDKLLSLRRSSLPVRPMSNMLKPFGVPRNAYLRGERLKKLESRSLAIPEAKSDPMPPTVGAVIHTEKGYRKLQAEELAKGLGIPKEWSKNGDGTFGGTLLSQAIGINALDAVMTTLRRAVAKMDRAQHQEEELLSELPEEKEDLEFVPFESNEGTWSWKAPSLLEGGRFYEDSITALKTAIQTEKLPLEATMEAGRQALARHRQNYGPKGPQVLQMLWWQMPTSSWTELREGSSMNFLEPPPFSRKRNNLETTEQIATAGAFLDELITLGALEEAEEDSIECVAPLFCLPKPGQVGEWRVISDMKSGGQNACIGTDPVFLPRVPHILPELYAGGYSAVVDASKFFYQFLTIPAERKYMGVRHPVTGKYYRYRGLPMGSGNSPAIAGRHGAAFLRKLKEHPLFTGEPQENTWRASFAGEHEYDSKLGHGLILLSKDDGLPAVKLWVHVDDFLIHGPTYEKTASALSTFMDAALEVGLLCNPVKVHPPKQRAKYCGFILDTTRMPTMEVPEDKTSRARAMVEILVNRGDRPVTRMALTMATGVLQSMVDATPARAGATYLRRLYDLLYDGRADLPTFDWTFYAEEVNISDTALEDLRWWQTALSIGVRRPIRYEEAATLVPFWGDGSGTGTGGTKQFGTQLTMWIGVWLTKVHSFSSNWKELRTLVAALDSEEELDGGARVRGKTVFYFTDNMVTYHLASKGMAKDSLSLQDLLYRLKLLELRLGCILEVVHVPGRLMIRQGTDGLSRGMWMSAEQFEHHPTQLNALVFAAIPYSMELHSWVDSLDWQHLLPWDHMVFCDWHQPMTAETVFDRGTLWCFPPEVARQRLSDFLQLWIERPWTTWGVFILPRVLQRQWYSLSRHLRELAVFDCETIPWGPTRPILSIPISVMYIAPHQRTLNNHRLDTAAGPTPLRWIREQAQLLYGM